MQTAHAAITPKAETLAEATRRTRATGLRGFVGRLLRVRLAAAAIMIVLVVILAALFAPWLATHDPESVDLVANLAPPSREHWFGTDNLGRDTYSRLIYGARVSLQVGVVAVGIALVIGTTLGLLAGYARVGLTDTIIMRCMDALLAFPTLVLALAITGALGPSLTNVMVAVGVIGIPTYARLVRGQVLSVGEREFVESARVAGASDVRIVLRHILPNVTAPLIVQASLGVAVAIISEASLSFLGLGVQPPTPSWGSMLSVGKDWLQYAWWMAMAPGFAIFIVVVSINFLGDGIRDALDPRLQ